MTAAVGEVQFEGGFVKASFAGLELIVEQRGFVNATHLCRLKGKPLCRYNESQPKKSLKLMLTTFYGELSHKVTGHEPCLTGTYFHPALLLDLAAWLAPQTFIDAAVIINAFFNRTDLRKAQLRELFACEDAVYEHQPPNCRIRFDSFEALVNERGWFEAAQFCRALSSRVEDFEKRKQSAPLLEYFGAIGLCRGAYYHPLLLLRLAAWVNLEAYVRLVHVVFCCQDRPLKALFRRQIAAAGAASIGRPETVGRAPANGELPVRGAGSSTSGAAARGPTLHSAVAGADRPGDEVAGSSTSVAAARRPNSQAGADRPRISVVAPAKLLVNGNGLLADTPSSGQAAPARPNLANIIWNTADDDSEDSDMTMDMSHEADHTLTRQEHEVELNRLRRELEQKVERERQAKEAAMAREQEQAAALARVEREKREALERERAKDDKLEELQRQLEDMQIDESRMTLRKRSYAESRANAAAAVLREQGVAKLECLVLFVSTENAVYGYRRQFQSIIPVIHKQLHKVTAFVGWFVTNNAVLDFNRCKTKVEEKAKECQRNVRFTQNQMELADKEGANFDLPDTIRTTLRIDLQVIEADVRILARLFKRPTYGDYVVPAKPPNAFLASVHKWIEDEHASFTSVLTRRRNRRKQ